MHYIYVAQFSIEKNVRPLKSAPPLDDVMSRGKLTASILTLVDINSFKMNLR